MKSIAITVILLVLTCSVSRAQDSLRLQRYEYVIGAALAFSFADYAMDNHLRADAGWPSNYRVPVLYRVVEGAAQVGITYFLYKNFGLPSAISFNFLSWTGCLDWAYYAWLNTLRWIKPPGPLGHPVANTWSGWTPIGLLRPQGSAIAQNTINAQVGAGFTIGMTILW